MTTNCTRHFLRQIGDKHLVCRFCPYVIEIDIKCEFGAELVTDTKHDCEEQEDKQQHCT